MLRQNVGLPKWLVRVQAEQRYLHELVLLLIKLPLGFLRALSHPVVFIHALNIDFIHILERSILPSLASLIRRDGIWDLVLSWLPRLRRKGSWQDL